MSTDASENAKTYRNTDVDMLVRHQLYERQHEHEDNTRCNNKTYKNKQAGARSRTCTRTHSETPNKNTGLQLRQQRKHKQTQRMVDTKCKTLVGNSCYKFCPHFLSYFLLESIGVSAWFVPHWSAAVI